MGWFRFILFIVVAGFVACIIGMMVHSYFMYVDEVKYQASKYNPTLSTYKTDDNIRAQVYIIDHAITCDEMKKLFERNSSWWSLPKLADKIERTCF